MMTPRAVLAALASISVVVYSEGHGAARAVAADPGYVAESTVSTYRTIAGTNLHFGLDAAAAITSPFPIQFGDSLHNVLYVGSHGHLNFDTFAPVKFANTPLPTTAFSTLVAPFWDDIGGTESTAQNVFWEVTGSAPHRELVVEWRGVWHFPCPTSATVTFQVVFFEGRSDILFNYADTEFGGSCASFDRGASATVGVQLGPSQATGFSVDTPSLADGTSVLFTYVPIGPQAFAKIAPVDGAGDQEPIVTLEWAAASGAATYEYCLDRVDNDACDTSWESTGEATRAVVALESPDREYYWQVRASNSDGVRPANGRVWWRFTARAFAAARLISPAPGETLRGSRVTFVWEAGFGANEYSLWIGSTPGGSDFNRRVAIGLLQTVNGLPTDGRTLYVRLWSRIGVSWIYHDAVFAAAAGESADIAPIAVPADYDGDGKADMATWIGSIGLWNIPLSSAGNRATLQLTWGRSSDGAEPVVGDYDGDGKADPAVWNRTTGEWLVLRSTSDGFYNQRLTLRWGNAGYNPVPGDYDGDGTTDPTSWERHSGIWYVLKSTVGFAEWSGVAWGRAPQYEPVPADYDGDGRTDPAVWEAGTGEWYVLRSSAALREAFVLPLGETARDAQPVRGDFDGDGKTDPAVWHPSTGVWSIRTSGTQYTQHLEIAWGRGAEADSPAPADYDGDGTADIAVWRPTQGTWYVLTSASGFKEWFAY